jgi:hypothetical protein
MNTDSTSNNATAAPVTLYARGNVDNETPIKVVGWQWFYEELLAGRAWPVFGKAEEHNGVAVPVGWHLGGAVVRPQTVTPEHVNPFGYSIYVDTKKGTKDMSTSMQVPSPEECQTAPDATEPMTRFVAFLKLRYDRYRMASIAYNLDFSIEAKRNTFRALTSEEVNRLFVTPYHTSNKVSSNTGKPYNDHVRIGCIVNKDGKVLTRFFDENRAPMASPEQQLTCFSTNVALTQENTLWMQPKSISVPLKSLQVRQISAPVKRAFIPTECMLSTKEDEEMALASASVAIDSDELLLKRVREAVPVNTDELPPAKRARVV